MDNLKNQVFLFAMDSYSPAAVGIFDKIKQAAGESDCFILFHQRYFGKINQEVLRRPHFIVTNKQLLELGYAVDINKSLIPGNCHLPLMYFFSKHKYSHYWYIEYDVRFSGNWHYFFSYFNKSEEDFIASHVRFYKDEPDWIHWKSMGHPFQKIDYSKMLKAFCPIYRVSYNALAAINNKQKEGWVGHQEVIFPTFLHELGFSIRDFGGAGYFVQAGDENLFYNDSIISNSMRYRPEHIFYSFKKKNKLYHPVKSRKVFRWLTAGLDRFVGKVGQLIKRHNQMKPKI